MLPQLQCCLQSSASWHQLKIWSFTVAPLYVIREHSSHRAFLGLHPNPKVVLSNLRWCMERGLTGHLLNKFKALPQCPLHQITDISVVKRGMSFIASSTERLLQTSHLADPWLLPPTSAEVHGWLPIQKDPLSQWADRPNIWRCLESWASERWNLLPDPEAAYRQPHQVRVVGFAWP